MAVLLVDDSRKPADRPGRRRRLVGRRPAKRGHSLLQPPLLHVDPREIERPIGALEPFHLAEGSLCLAQLALVGALAALANEPDAVIVPAPDSVTPEGILTVSPEVPNVKVVPVLGSTLSTFIKLILQLNYL